MLAVLIETKLVALPIVVVIELAEDYGGIEKHAAHEVIKVSACIGRQVLSWGGGPRHLCKQKQQGFASLLDATPRVTPACVK